MAEQDAKDLSALPSTTNAAVNVADSDPAPVPAAMRTQRRNGVTLDAMDALAALTQYTLSASTSTSNQSLLSTQSASSESHDER